MEKDIRNEYREGDFRRFFREGIRVLLMLLTIGAIAYIFYCDAHCKILGNRFAEGSFTENTQVAMLLFSGICFLSIRWVYSRYRSLGYILSAPAFMAFVRENDSIFDAVCHYCWQMLFFSIALAAAIYFWINRKSVLRLFNEYFHTASWGILISGFVTTFAFSRIMGIKTNWKSLLSGYDLQLSPVDHGMLLRNIRRAAEEGVELLGYTLIAVAAVSLVIHCNRLRRADVKGSINKKTVQNQENHE